MTVIRIGVTLITRTCSRPLFSGTIYRYNQSKLIMDVSSVRNLSTMEITKNISLISGEKKNVELKDLRLMPPQDKPLVIMLSWLLAKPKHIKKYADFYVDRGFDVLNINISPWQLLWPSKGTQIVAKDILKFLDSNFTYSPLMIHGFSVGAYVWGEVLVKVVAELPKYKPLVDRFLGQVWDSAADITEIPVGFPKALFPTNPVMQGALRQYILYHMKTFDKVATCHYLRSSQMFHTNVIKAPALFFLSKNDPVGAEDSNQRVRETWESSGIDVTWKIWDRSPHVGHFAKHPHEYSSELINFINRVYAGDAQKIQAKAKL